MRINRSRCLVAAALLTGLFAQAHGDELPPVEVSSAISTRMHWIQFHMISGRVVGTSNLNVPKTFVQSQNRRSRHRQTLSIEITAGVCGMQYDSFGTDDRLKVALSDSSELLIRRTRPNDQYSVEFRQSPDRALALELGQGESKRRFEAGGFWRLYLAEPEVVREHLIPLLELLRPSWQLAATGAEIEDRLIHSQPAPAGGPPDRKRWAQLVKELASPKFAERENAQRELHRAGQAVVPYLQSLDAGRLDAEQVSRVNAVIDLLSVDYEDRVERVAAWLASDERAWLALLNRDDPLRRAVAAKQLAQLMGEPIEFDPDAAEPVRGKQIERLRSRLQRAEPAAPSDVKE